MAAVASGFCTIVATRVLALISSSERCGQTFVRVHMQLSCVYLVSTLDIMHVIKCTTLSATLAGRAWERGYTYNVDRNDPNHLVFMFVCYPCLFFATASKLL